MALATLMHERRRTVFGILSAIFIGVAVLTSGIRWEMANPMADKPGSEELSATLQKLISNLYVAMNEHDPAMRDKALLISLGNKQLEKIAMEAERGLIVELASGGRAQTHEVTKMSTETIHPGTRNGSVSTVARWTSLVAGSHWGHDHRRAVKFEALVSLSPVKGHWKIYDMTITSRN